MKWLFFLFTGLGLLSLLSFSNDELARSIARGKDIYNELCVQCHLGKGEGVAGAIPPLAGADFLAGDKNQVIRVVKFGQQGAITVNGKTYNGYMPAPGLEDQEIADVVNFILNTWGNRFETMITAAEVAAIE